MLLTYPAVSRAASLMVCGTLEGRAADVWGPSGGGASPLSFSTGGSAPSRLLLSLTIQRRAGARKSRLARTYCSRETYERVLRMLRTRQPTRECSTSLRHIAEENACAEPPVPSPRPPIRAGDVTPPGAVRTIRENSSVSKSVDTMMCPARYCTVIPTPHPSLYRHPNTSTRPLLYRHPNTAPVIVPSPQHHDKL